MTNKPPITRQRAVSVLTLFFEPNFIAYYRTTPHGFVLTRLLSGCKVAGRRKRKKQRWSYPVTIPTRIACGDDISAIIKHDQ